VIIVVVVILVGPGLGSLRDQLKNADPVWFAGACGMEVLSTLSYVVIFRAVFCGRMRWRTSYQIGMAEQAANSLLPAGGAGGLALGAWALHRVGMSADHIARRTVAFFFLTSLANVGTVVLIAIGFAAGILGHDAVPIFTYAFGGAAAVAIAIVVLLPIPYRRWRARRRPLRANAGRLRRGWRDVVDAAGEGASDTLLLLRERPVGVLVGSFGYMAFDIATLGLCFVATGHQPSFGVLVWGYLIGQLAGIIPIPGGIGATEGGLVGVYALYQVPVSKAVAAVLIYRALQLWIPAVLGSIAFVQLRETLKRESERNMVCQALADPIPGELPAMTAANRRPEGAHAP
jgi:uncharacterized membrane protein YbhN (UPF0104 family)